MTKILFVCHGNICRSTMAEQIMKHLVAARGLQDLFEIDSAAVSREEIGNPIYPPARAELMRRGIPVGSHRARQVTAAGYDRWDLLLCMDRSNVNRLMRIIGSDPDGKVHLVTEWTGRTAEVEDPWYTDRFDHVFDQLTEACSALLDALCTEVRHDQ